jgi:N-acetylgalactosamine kinase
VQQFRIEATTGGLDAAKSMSFLMRASHRSLKQLYECSHPNLDRLVELSDKLGVGARLTGAG